MTLRSEWDPPDNRDLYQIRGPSHAFQHWACLEPCNSMVLRPIVIPSETGWCATSWLTPRRRVFLMGSFAPFLSNFLLILRPERIVAPVPKQEWPVLVLSPDFSSSFSPLLFLLWRPLLLSLALVLFSSCFWTFCRSESFVASCCAFLPAHPSLLEQAWPRSSYWRVRSTSWPQVWADTPAADKVPREIPR